MRLSRRVFWNGFPLVSELFLVVVPGVILAVLVTVSDAATSAGMVWRALLTLVVLFWARAGLSGVVVGSEGIRGVLYGRCVETVPLAGVVRFESRVKVLHSRSGYPGRKGGRTAVLYAVYADGRERPIWPMRHGNPDRNPTAVRRTNEITRCLAELARADGHGEVAVGPDLPLPAGFAEPSS